MSGNFKAIETVYKGYRCRSRLEARWMIFFDALDIEFHYEPEGYVLDGKPYLPDFYLPHMDCFVEIKGVKPTQSEIEKAMDLCLYTGKKVFIFHGGIPLPPEHRNLECAEPPYIHVGSNTHDLEPYVRETSREVLIVLERIEEAFLKLDIVGGQLQLTHSIPTWYVNEQDVEMQDGFLYNMLGLQKLIPHWQFLKEHEDEIVDALTPPDDRWEVHFSSLFVAPVWQWYECSKCKEILLHRIGHPFYDPQVYHDDTCKGLLVNDSPRLMAAYVAARQARFGKEGRS
jgi:hypothetical protein